MPQEQETRTHNGFTYARQPDGSWRRVGRAVPVDPGYQVESATVQPQIQRSQAETTSAQAQASVDAATIDARRRQAVADADRAEAEAGAAQQTARRALTPAQEAVDNEFATMYAEMQASGGIADIRKQVGQLRDAAEVLRNTDTISGPVIGRMPEFIQQAIDPRAINTREQIEEVVQRNLRLILGAQFTQQEGERLISRAFNPRLQEGSNLDRLERLIEQMDTALNSRESAINYYEQRGTLAGWTAPRGGDPASSPENPQSVWDQIYAGAAAPMQAAGEGATTTRAPLPPGAQQAHRELIQRLAAGNNGRIDPTTYARERRALDEHFGLAPGSGYEGWANDVNRYLDEGGRTLPVDMQSPEQDLTEREQVRNDTLSTGPGTGLTMAANALGAGVAEGLLPEQTAAMRAQNPGWALGGDVLGAIGGTSGIGAIGRNTFGRLAPNLMADTGAARFGRNIATDAGYSGLYSANTGGDVLTDTARGTFGSASGQGIGKLLGSGVGGLSRTDAAQSLMDRGIRLSVGRQLGGGARRAEDLMQSIPVVGGRVRNRQLDSFQDFNQAAFREAGEPISHTPSNIGLQGRDELGDAVSQSYNDALQGRRVPVDPQFQTDLTGVAAHTLRLPDDLQPRVNRLLDNHTQALSQTGEMTGEELQRALRGLRSARNKASSVANEFDDVYRDTMTSAEDAFTGLAGRGGGQDVVDGLNRSNQSYRMSRVIDDASDRAAGGSQSGENFIFTPSQLQRAGIQNARRYGGNRPFAALADDGQSVLPSTIPNSGTADRAMAAGALATLGIGGAGLGGGAGYALGGSEGIDEGVMGGTGLAAALALLGTRQGQRAVQAALIDRPQAAQRIGRGINRRAGLFGSATMAPLVIGQQ